VHFRALSRDVEIGGTETPVELRYVTLGAGLASTF
jgi:hypothetical protein